MEHLEQMAMSSLALVEKFHEGVKSILADRLFPPSEGMNRINQLREQIRGEGEQQCDAFDREAQGLEKGLLRKLEQLKEIRERAALVPPGRGVHVPPPLGGPGDTGNRGSATGGKKGTGKGEGRNAGVRSLRGECESGARKIELSLKASGRRYEKLNRNLRTGIGTGRGAR